MDANRSPETRGRRPRARERAGVLVVAGAAFLGALVARVLDWRSHAHPR